MTWNIILGAASTITLFVPLFLIAYLRLFRDGSLLMLFFYYLLSGAYNLMALGLLPVSAAAIRTFGLVYNYLDVPLMLLVLLFFCTSQWNRRVIYFTLAAFLLFEGFIAFGYRLQLESSLYILGPGTLIVLGYSIYFFLHYGKISIARGKGLGKTLMLAAILFAYGCFALIYYLHYIQKTPAVADVFLVYYIVTLISGLVMSLGLVWVSKRMRQLQELQLMRKELAAFFNS